MATTSQDPTTPQRPSETYRRLAGRFSTIVDAVPARRWDDPSVCDGWTARDVLAHVVDSQSGFVTKVDLQIPAGPRPQEDPAAAWAHVHEQIQGIIDDPERAGREYDGAGGRQSIAQALASFFAIDLIVHGWDIAEATGGDTHIPARDVRTVFQFTRSAGDMLRSPGGFGPEVALDDPDADEQTRLLAFLGRRSR